MSGDSEAKTPEQKDKEHEDAEAFKMKAKADVANEDDSADPSAAEPEPTAAGADPHSPESSPMSPAIFAQNEDPKVLSGALKDDADDLSDTSGITPRPEPNTADLPTANPLGACVVSL